MTFDGFIAFVNCLEDMANVKPESNDYTGKMIVCLVIQVYKRYMAKAVFSKKVNNVTLSPAEAIAISLTISLANLPGIYEQTVLHGIRNEIIQKCA